MLHLLIKIALWHSFIHCELLKVNIPFCTVSFDKPVLLDQMCANMNNVKTTGNMLGNETVKVSGSTSMSIFTKLQHHVYGMGMECSRFKTKWLFRKTIFGDYYKSSETTFIRLSRSDCFEMKKKKICATKDNGETLKLECNGDVCSTEEKVYEPLMYTAGWWGDSYAEIYSCQIVPKLIIAVHESDHIFGTECVPTNLQCNLPRSIIVWEESIIMKCPFRPLKLNIQMKYIRNSNEEEMFIVRNNQLRLAFKSDGPANECGMHLVKTTEGLYLAPEEYKFEKIASAQLEQSLYDDKSEMGIKLASDDYNIVQEKEIENDLLMKECKLLQTTIELFSFQQDKFFKFIDLKNTELILYARNSQIYKPSCQSIESIFLNEKSLKCYEDFPVVFNYTTPNGKISTQINGFLTVNGIIKSIGREITCDDVVTYMKLTNSNISIRKLNNFYKVFYNLNYQQLNVHLSKYEPILDHNELLVNGVDYVRQMVGINRVAEINGIYNVIKPIIRDNKEHFSLANIVSNIVVYGSILLLILLVVFIVYNLIKFFIYLNKRSKKNKQYNDLKKCVEFVNRNKESSGSKTDNIPEV